MASIVCSEGGSSTKAFVFNTSTAMSPWLLVMNNPRDVLSVCRLPDDYDWPEIVFFLAQRGMSFHIFCQQPQYPSSPIRPPLSVPKRDFGHVFTHQDYKSYLELRTELLSQPHMQAALRRGGLVWRLTVDVLGLSNILSTCGNAPTSLSLKHCSKVWVEDDLTTVELDILCGAYECSSGACSSPNTICCGLTDRTSDDGVLHSLKSWWPLVCYYKKSECGENYGRWCQHREEWYTGCLADFQDISCQP
jgi:hypothetical protein